MKVYIVAEPPAKGCPSTYSDEQFMDEAEYQGFVYSLEGFQKQWNENKLDADPDYHWIRFL